ncbi:proline dehydrogenase [Halomicrobium mukohataei]|uniref:proline dehydrogenase n=1 Tax=Halomicrobium mukohataei TaxID=57705 RepID=A0A847U8W5_9EURY|nr:proline dehydrogenase family protein [Halomicrobium mukohataei]NLV09439.1 proline dehydrogenase [Halomicrobium mukohataei]
MIPPLARRFVAGETTAGALEHARQCNEEGIGVILNQLGEHYDRREPAAEATATYEALVEEIDLAGLDACLSIKPSQLGLDVSEALFQSNLDSVVTHAADRDVFVWIDMEDHTTTDATLDAFERLARQTDGGVGVCVQANLRRTPDDLERLADLPGKIRLVKGAYDPPQSVALQDKAEIDQAYRDQLGYLFEHFRGEVAVGSHDPEMIDLAASLHEEYGTPYEVQMLMGVRDDAQRSLATDSEVWQYAPYGGEWLAYFYRRVAERKENALFALRAILS